MKAKAIKWCIVSIWMLFAFFVFRCTQIEYWYGDDMLYQYNARAYVENIPVDNLVPIQTVADVFESVNFHYLNVNGRYTAHIIVQLFCGLLGQTAFAFCNMMLSLIFLYLVMKLSGADMRRVSHLLLALGLCLFSFKAPGGSPFAVAIQVNYIWMPVLSMIWILLFFKPHNWRKWQMVLLVVFSVLAGNGQEAYNIGICAGASVYIITRLRKLYMSQWVLFFAFVIGCVSDCISPGTLARQHHETIAPPLWTNLFHLFFYTKSFWLLCIVLIIDLLRGRVRTVVDFFRDNIFFIVSAISLLVFNFIIGRLVSVRQFSGVELFSIILVLRYLLKLGGWSKGSYLYMIGVWMCVPMIWSNMSVNHLFFTSNKLEELEEKYRLSQPGDTIWMNCLHTTFEPNKYSGKYSYMWWCHMQLKYQRRDIPRIYPEILKDINPTDSLLNVAVEIGGGRWLLVRGKNNPAQFFITKNIIIGSWIRRVVGFESLVKFDSYTKMSAPGWDAVIVDMNMPFCFKSEIRAEIKQ